MEFPCKEPPGRLTGTFTWNSHVRNGVYRHLYMEFPCKDRGSPGLQVPLHGIPMSERGRRTGFHGNSHVNISLVFIYMADPMQISLSKLQWSLRRASETHFSKLSDFIIRHPIFGGLSRRRCKCQNLVMLWKFNLTNLSGHMTDMLWIPLAVILWTPMPANWCQVDLPS